jgi:hypothetical protein
MLAPFNGTACGQIRVLVLFCFHGNCLLKGYVKMLTAQKRKVQIDKGEN